MSSFILRADARTGGKETFREDIDQLQQLNFAGTTFNALEVGDTSATLRGDTPTGEDVDDSFAATFEDHLVSSHGVYLDLEVLPDA